MRVSSPYPTNRCALCGNNERSAVKNSFSKYVWSKVDSHFCEFLYWHMNYGIYQRHLRSPLFSNRLYYISMIWRLIWSISISISKSFAVIYRLFCYVIITEKVLFKRLVQHLRGKMSLAPSMKVDCDDLKKNI